jgi:hypothetical protein
MGERASACGIESAFCWGGVSRSGLGHRMATGAGCSPIRASPSRHSHSAGRIQGKIKLAFRLQHESVKRHPMGSETDRLGPITGEAISTDFSG